MLLCNNRVLISDQWETVFLLSGDDMKVHVFRLVENSEAEVIFVIHISSIHYFSFRVQFMRNPVIHGFQSWLTFPAGLTRLYMYSFVKCY